MFVQLLFSDFYNNVDKTDMQWSREVGHETLKKLFQKIVKKVYWQKTGHSDHGVGLLY